MAEDADHVQDFMDLLYDRLDPLMERLSGSASRKSPPVNDDDVEEAFASFRDFLDRGIQLPLSLHIGDLGFVRLRVTSYTRDGSLIAALRNPEDTPAMAPALRRLVEAAYQAGAALRFLFSADGACRVLAVNALNE